MQLIDVGRIGPNLRFKSRDSLCIKLPQIRCLLRIDPTARRHRLSTPLFQRRIVKKRVRFGGQNLLREWRWLGRVACNNGDFARFDFAQQRFKTVDVHRFMQTVIDGLLDQGMIGNFAFADEVFRASDLIWKYRRDQVFRRHALQLRRRFFAAAKSWQRQRDGRVPTPARGKHRRGQQCLHQNIAHTIGMQITLHFFQRKTVTGRERQNNRIFRRRRLQLEIELAAKTFAQTQTPGAVDAAAIRRMDDQLHAAGFVEETFEHDRSLCRQTTERLMRGE